MKVKNQVIKFNQELCRAAEGLTEEDLRKNRVLFVRVSDEVSAPDARFEVPITHDAIVIKGGGDMRYYRSGNYDVFSDKKEAKQWKKGMSVEIIYIPKDTAVPIIWGTAEPEEYRDETSNVVIKVGARGQCDVTVSNPEQFFRKIVGVQPVFNLKEFKERFRLEFASQFGNIFLKVVAEQHLTYDQFGAHKTEIAAAMEAILTAKFEREFGLAVRNFFIEGFQISDEHKAAIEAAADEKAKQAQEEAKEKERQEKMKEYLAELERLDDKEWEREKYLRQLELQDKAAYYEVMKVVGSGSTKPEEKLLCPSCGFEYKPTDKFCPRCGKRLTKEPIICPDCGKSNPSDTIFCSNCGKKLIGG